MAKRTDSVRRNLRNRYEIYRLSARWGNGRVAGR